MKTTTVPTAPEGVSPGVNIHSISISNVLGIRELKIEVPAGGAVFAGPNASGKTSAIEAIRMALTGQGVSAKAIRRSATKGEIFLDLSHPSIGNLLVTRSITLRSGGKLEVTGPDGNPLPAPQGILNKLLGAAPLCPLALWKADKKEQRALILSAMPCEVTAAQFKTLCAEANVSTGFVAAMLGGVPIAGDDVPIPGHGLEHLAKAQTYFYDRRKKANEHAREAEGEAQQARQRLADAVETFGPDEVLPVEEAEKRLDDARHEALKAQARNAAAIDWTARTSATQIKIAGMRAAVDLEFHPLPRVPTAEEMDAAYRAGDAAEEELARANHRVIELEKLLEQARADASTARDASTRARGGVMKLRNEEAVHQEAAAKRLAVLEQADALEASIGAPPARVEVDHLAVHAAEKALARARGGVALEGVREDVTAAEAAATAARAGAADLDTIVKRLTNEAPGQLFNPATAIPGLKVTEDSFELDGVDIANLSGKEKLFFCTDVMRRLSKGKILFVELEALQPSLIPEFLAYASRDSFTVFATRIADDGKPYRVESISEAQKTETERFRDKLAAMRTEAEAEEGRAS